MEPQKEIEECIAIARESLDSGRALATLKNLSRLINEAMKDILSEIIAHKQTEIELQKQTVSGTVAGASRNHHPGECGPPPQHEAGPCRFFYRNHLRVQTPFTLQRLDKRGCPGRGNTRLLRSRRPGALSILTDGKFFGGTLRDIRTARPLVHIPILRKDFIIDEYQLLQACIVGADAVLLIASCLSPEQCSTLTAKPTNSGWRYCSKSTALRNSPI